MAAGLRTIKIRFTGEAKDLDRAAKSATKAVEKVSSTVTSAAAGVAGKVQQAIGALPPQGMAIAAVLTAGMAPVIGAAISAAILGAVGGGVLALGIKSAADNPKVAAAFAGLKKKASKTFEDFGKPFEGPLIRAAETFGKTLDKLKPHIDRLGELMAPVIDKLAPKLGEFFEKVMPGIEKATEASLPMFDKLAEHLPKIGDAIGDFFTSISENGDDAATFFGDLLTAIEWIIRAFGWLISKLTEWYGAHRRALVQAKDKFVAFKNGAIEAGRNVVEWFKGLPERIKNGIGSVKDKLVGIFRSAFNAVVRLWNGTIGNLSWTVPGWVPGIGGNSISAPRLSERASGGPVSAGRSYLIGERGPEVLTMGGGGGFITPNREIGGGDVYEVHVHLADEVTKVLRLERRDLKRRAGARGAYA
ncbi:hypothetical protein [Actinoplanes sp. NPDC049802]|uniref:hypothetical protein n=1 Tax=Actinoplanes sp. NPDC049802 TaxID=3154742 RepID=UPI0033E1F45B